MFPLRSILKKSKKAPKEQNELFQEDLRELKYEVHSLQRMVKNQNLMIDELISLYKVLNQQHQQEKQKQIHRCYLCYSREILDRYESQKKTSCLICKQFYGYKLSLNQSESGSLV